MREGIGEHARAATAMLLASLFVVVPALFAVDADAGVLGAVVALAVLAWAVRQDPAVVRLVVSAATASVREARRVRRRAGPVRQCDPDADGRPRPRAPGLLQPEQSPA